MSDVSRTVREGLASVREGLASAWETTRTPGYQPTVHEMRLMLGSAEMLAVFVEMLLEALETEDQ